jgi:hypothetical protein
MTSETSVPLTVECEVHFRQQHRGRKELRDGADTRPALPIGRVPRVSRLAALALRFEGLVRTGAVANYSRIAALGQVTRARVSQVMNLLNLAPDVLEEILFLPRTVSGRDPIHLALLQPIAGTFDWQKQRRLWRELCRHGGVGARD